MNSRIEIVRGDITQLKVDAVVNAANNSLLGGGGVDGAIHRAAGTQLLKACKALNGCATGEAKSTPGFNLPAKYVIHTVGPVWEGGAFSEAQLLAACYVNSMREAIQLECETVAFPAISTGVYGFPKQKAAEIAFDTLLNILDENNSVKKVFFVIFDSENFEIYSHISGII